MRQAAILEAEGEAEAIKKVADATKFEKLTVAEGEGQAIERVYGAIHNGNPTNDLIAIKYLEALGTIANGQATKVFLPLETSGILGSIAGIGELYFRVIIQVKQINIIIRADKQHQSTYIICKNR